MGTKVARWILYPPKDSNWVLVHKLLALTVLFVLLFSWQHDPIGWLTKRVNPSWLLIFPGGILFVYLLALTPDDDTIADFVVRCVGVLLMVGDCLVCSIPKGNTNHPLYFLKSLTSGFPWWASVVLFVVGFLWLASAREHVARPIEVRAGSLPDYRRHIPDVASGGEGVGGGDAADYDSD